MWALAVLGGDGSRARRGITRQSEKPPAFYSNYGCEIFGERRARQTSFLCHISDFSSPEFKGLTDFLFTLLFVPSRNFLKDKRRFRDADYKRSSETSPPARDEA